MKQYLADQTQSYDLRRLADKLIRERDSLFRSRDGCVCNELNVCAHHSPVVNALTDAIKAVTMAAAFLAE